jgi:predicted outer membrane protein
MRTISVALALLLAGPATARDAPSSEQLLESVYQLHVMHMELGQLAWEKGGTREIRSLGEREFRDHRLAARQVERLASRLGHEVGLLPVDALSDAMRQLRERGADLRAAEQPAFDPLFLQALLDSHDEARRMLTIAAVATTDESVVRLMDRLLPVVEQHERLARQVAAMWRAS